MSIRWIILFSCALSFARAQTGYSRDNPSNQLGYNPFGRIESDEDALNGDEIPGEPGTDYPIYSSVPRTGFSCNNQQYPGYYADPEAQCQAFYVCRKSGRGVSFLCPNGTIFNQERLVCDWWYNFDCDSAQQFYSVNEMINREMEEVSQKLQQQQGGYNYNAPNGGSDRITQQRPGQTYGVPSPVYGVPGQSNGRPSQNYGVPQNDRYNNQRNGANTPRPVYGPPSSNQGYTQNGFNGNSFNPQDRTYLPPSRYEQNGNSGNNQAYKNGLGNGPSNPDRSYLPPSNYRNGNTPSPQYGVPGQGDRYSNGNGYNRASPNRSYLPPSK